MSIIKINYCLSSSKRDYGNKLFAIPSTTTEDKRMARILVLNRTGLLWIRGERVFLAVMLCLCDTGGCACVEMIEENELDMTHCTIFI